MKLKNQKHCALKSLLLKNTFQHPTFRSISRNTSQKRQALLRWTYSNWLTTADGCLPSIYSLSLSHLKCKHNRYIRSSNNLFALWNLLLRTIDIHFRPTYTFARTSKILALVCSAIAKAFLVNCFYFILCVDRESVYWKSALLHHSSPRPIRKVLWRNLSIEVFIISVMLVEYRHCVNNWTIIIFYPQSIWYRLKSNSNYSI